MSLPINITPAGLFDGCRYAVTAAKKYGKIKREENDRHIEG